MKTILLLFLVQGLALLFLLVPYDAYNPVLIQPFPFSDQQIIPRSFVWMIFEKINYIILIYAIRINISRKYTGYMSIFLLLEILRFAEFLLNYNSPWLVLEGYTLGLSHFFTIFKAIIVIHALWEQSK